MNRCDCLCQPDQRLTTKVDHAPGVLPMILTKPEDNKAIPLVYHVSRETKIDFA